MKNFIYKKIAVSMTLVLLCGTAFARKVIEETSNSDPSASEKIMTQPLESPIPPIEEEASLPPSPSLAVSNPEFLDLIGNQNREGSSNKEVLPSDIALLLEQLLENSKPVSPVQDVQDLFLLQQQQLETKKFQADLETQKQKIELEKKEVELRKKELELKEKELELKEKQIGQERELEKILAAQRLKEEAEQEKARLLTEQRLKEEAEAQRLREEAEAQPLREETPQPAMEQAPKEDVPIVVSQAQHPPSSPPSVIEYAVRRFLKKEDIGWVDTREKVKEEAVNFLKSFF